MAEAVDVAVHRHLGTEHGRESLSVGAGGDRTAVVDRVAEDVVIAECERLAREGARFLLRSEEVGDRDFGAAHPVLLVDPVDGSINAKQGLPYHCTSLALVEGDSFAEVTVGVVRSLAGPGTYSAVKGQGVWRDGHPLKPLQVRLTEQGVIPVVLLEAVLSPPLIAQHHRLLDAAGRVRLLGAAALSLCQAASGAASAFVAPGGLRSFDCAAGLVILDEAGAVVTDRQGGPVGHLPADLSTRVRLVASLSVEVHQRVLSLLD
jgi:myo-inositol-1(or 4)-monophosphatase